MYIYVATTLTQSAKYGLNSMGHNWLLFAFAVSKTKLAIVYSYL